MSTLDEAFNGQGTPLNAALVGGIDTQSFLQEVTFIKYVRVVLPLDGFVFWVRATIINPTALLNVSAYNDLEPGMPYVAPTEAPEIKVKGSFHYLTDIAEEETESSSTNRVIFTSEAPVQAFNSVGPNVMYIGTFTSPVRKEDETIVWEGETIRFAFSNRASFYKQANIYHYVGHAVYSVLQSQIIEDPRDLDTRLVVSNSLPIWLSMNSYVVNAPWELFPKPSFPLFPSYLAPQNEKPPFATVHVVSETTRGLQSTPSLGPTASHSQLCTETVRITLYGLRNETAMDFVDFVNQFSLNTDLIGLMNIPVMRDEKRPQAEFNAIAMRKAIDYEVSYYQEQARNLARQLIKTVILHYQVGRERFS